MPQFRYISLLAQKATSSRYTSVKLLHGFGEDHLLPDPTRRTLSCSLVYRRGRVIRGPVTVLAQNLAGSSITSGSQVRGGTVYLQALRNGFFAQLHTEAIYPTGEAELFEEGVSLTAIGNGDLDGSVTVRVEGAGE